MVVSCFYFFIFLVNGKGDGDEISFRYFIFNVCSGISVCLYDCCEYLNVGFALVTGS